MLVMVKDVHGEDMSINPDDVVGVLPRIQITDPPGTEPLSTVIIRGTDWKFYVDEPVASLVSRLNGEES